MFHSLHLAEMTMQERLEERDRIRDARLVREACRDRGGAGDAADTGEHGEAEGPAGIKRAFLEHAGRSVAMARLRSGLSREQVAQAAGVSRSTVESLEEASPTGLTMEQYVDLALACGSMPLELTLAPTPDMREFASEVPIGNRSATAFDAWLARRGVRRAVIAAGTPIRKSE
jgi:transcriptional regulator with XRE-family HTH domain